MVSLKSGLTVLPDELSFLQLVICFVIGCVIWDAVKYLFRKAVALERNTVNDGASQLKPKVKDSLRYPAMKKVSRNGR